MKVSIHQPDYIPYWGYFYKMYKSDAFVFLDDCQFSNNNMHNWSRIKTPQGECRLKIPVEQHLGSLINEVRTKDELKWKEKHLRTIEMNYKKSLYFNEIFNQFAEILNKEYPSLSEMNIAINRWIACGFGFNTVFFLSSEIKTSTHREDRILEICKKLDADEYMSGNGARAYQKEENFSSKGIELIYSDYKPLEYEQLWGDFISNMSIIDYIFNCNFANPFASHKED